MGNELAKALKRKVDSQFRVTAEDRTPTVTELSNGATVFVDPGEYTSPLVAGKNVEIGNSGASRTINAKMNVIAGENIEVSDPDPTTGAITIDSITVIKNQKTNSEIKIWVGTEGEFLGIATPDPNTLYFRSM